MADLLAEVAPDAQQAEVFVFPDVMNYNIRDLLFLGPGIEHVE